MASPLPSRQRDHDPTLAFLIFERAVARCRGLPAFIERHPGVPLRSTPEGFMLPPGSQAKALD